MVAKYNSTLWQRACAIIGCAFSPSDTIASQSHPVKRELQSGLDLSFAGSQGEYHCMWRCSRPGLNPSGLVNNSSLAAGPQFTEMKIL